MNTERNRMVLAGLALCLSLLFLWLGGFWGNLGATACLLLLGALALKIIPDTVSAAHAPKPDPLAATETPLMRTAAETVNSAIEGVSGEVLGSRFRMSSWTESEKTVDGLLDTCIRLLRQHLDAHTIAIFFPSHDNGYKIRRFDSKSEFINREAVIYPGVGVIGGFLKNGLKQLTLQEILTDSMTLYYYTRDAGIRSLMASPIVVEGVERGTIIADSTTVKHFTDTDHAYLTAIAELLGQAVFATYTATSHKLEHLRLVAMSTIEKDFFANLTLDTIIDKMVSLIPFAISCDRLTISLRLGDSQKAVVKRVWGTHTEGLQDRTFSLDDKTLMGLLFSKNILLYRNFAPGHYEARYGSDEPKHAEFASFLAFPLGVDHCKGALLLESTQRDAFTHSNRDLLLRLTTSAGLAIEKISILEKAQAMAAHDGLTGLTNRRQFEIALRDEITRALRYKEPLSLVICDLDHFKKVNDTYGHQHGDSVLKFLAATLSSSVRDGVDVAARYGGEEFALVLVKTDTKAAQETAERIRIQIARAGLKTPQGAEMPLTMSFGIATLGEHVKSVPVLIEKADKALYRAKENGRNRVEVF